jgi:hypothetical protein
MSAPFRQGSPAAALATSRPPGEKTREIATGPQPNPHSSDGQPRWMRVLGTTTPQVWLASYGTHEQCPTPKVSHYSGRWGLVVGSARNGPGLAVVGARGYPDSRVGRLALGAGGPRRVGRRVLLTLSRLCHDRLRLHRMHVDRRRRRSLVRSGHSTIRAGSSRVYLATCAASTRRENAADSSRARGRERGSGLAKRWPG